MKRNFLFSMLLAFGFITMSLTGFTGCLNTNGSRDAAHISETELEQLEGDVDAVVKAYFKEKYDVQAVVTDQTIAGGVFLGPDPSAERYYNLTVSITDGADYTMCNAEVYGKRVNGKIELYVKNESYYGKVMEDKMLQWIEPYILQADFHDYLIEYSCTEICFPSEYATDFTADAFISLTSKDRKLAACFHLMIPESEYMQHENLSEELDDLKNHLTQIDGAIVLYMYVYDENDYNQIKNGSDSHFDSILSSKIFDCTE